MAVGGPHSESLCTAADPSRAGVGAQRGTCTLPQNCQNISPRSVATCPGLISELSQITLMGTRTGALSVGTALPSERRGQECALRPAPSAARRTDTAPAPSAARDCGAQQTHGWLGNSKREGALCYCRGGGGRVWGFLPFVFHRFSFPPPLSFFLRAYSMAVNHELLLRAGKMPSAVLPH